MKPLLSCLNGDKPNTPPIWLMRQAGRYLPEYRQLRQQAPNFVEFCFNPEMAAEATLQPIRRFGMDGAILFADILLIPHALGCPVRFMEGVGPVFEPITSADALSQTEEWREIVAPVGETVRRVRAALPAETTLIGFAGAPWTVATYLVEGGTSRDHAKTRAWAFSDPVGFDALIQRLVDTTVDYLAMQVDAGADVVQLFDSWAGALPADGIERWSLAPCVAVATRLRERYPQLPVIVFPRAVGPAAAWYATSGAFAGVGIDSSIPPQWAAETLQPHCVVQGNLDPLVLRAGGEALQNSAQSIQRALQGGRHIFNLGHGVVPDTSLEHVGELVRLIRGEV
jgi:uroporphyrinogen decarboxylase